MVADGAGASRSDEQQPDGGAVSAATFATSGPRQLLLQSGTRVGVYAVPQFARARNRASFQDRWRQAPQDAASLAGAQLPGMSAFLAQSPRPPSSPA